ncbi:FtsX-like permease family protein [Clostridiaceae bacterium M8S5]|nr:FtsX-like permease family protein [Clostridiaceae bacterium M8S5]
MNKLIFNDIFKNKKLFFGTFLSVIVSVTIICSCLSLLFGALELKDYGHRFDGVDIVVSNNNEIVLKYNKKDKIKTHSKDVDGNIPLNDSDISYLSEKYDCVFDYTFYINAKKLSYRKIAGHNASSMDLTKFSIVKGNVPSKKQVLIDNDLANKNNLNVGDSILIETKRDKKLYTVSGIVSSSLNNIYDLQNYVFFDDDTAISLSNGCYNVGIKSQHIQNDINKLKDHDFNVLTGDSINKGELFYIAYVNSSLFIIFLTMAFICVVISGFVLSGTIKFSIKHRLKSFALLRILGFTKSKINRLISVQNIFIGLIGGIIGIYTSIPVSKFIADGFFRLGVTDISFKPISNLSINILSVICILLLISIVSFITARKTLKIAPMSAFKQIGGKFSEYSIMSVLIGIILIAGGISIAKFTPFRGGIGVGMGFLSCSVFLGGIMLLSPVIMIIINFLLSIFTRNMHNSLGQVASANVKIKASKFAIASISIAIMISINGVMVLNNMTYIKTVTNAKYDIASNYPYIVTNISNQDIPRTASYTGIKTLDILVNKKNKLNKLRIIGANNVSLNITIKGFDSSRKLSDNQIILSEYVHGFNIGDDIEVWFTNGSKKIMTVVGFYNINSNYIGEIYDAIISDKVAFENSFDNKYNTIYLNNKIANAKENSLSYYQNNPAFDIQVAATLLMIGISILLSVIALFNTFAIIMSVRQREFNSLKIVGAKKSQIFKMTVIETLIVVTTGLLLGTSLIIAICGHYSYVNTGVFDYIVNSKIFFSLIIGSFVLGLLAGLLPSKFTIKRLKQQVRSE